MTRQRFLLLSLAFQATFNSLPTVHTFTFSSIPRQSFDMHKHHTNLKIAASDDTDASEPKVCLVTGGSTGIGRAISLEFAKARQNVVVNYIAGMEDLANKVVEEVKDLGGGAIAVEADCSDPKAIAKMFDTIINTYGKCDILVNNAGITRDGLVMRMTPEQWQSVIDINLSGVFYCSQAFFKVASKTKNRSGRIINMASVVGQIGNPGQANYGAAKGGVIGLTKCNAKEFAARGITVNCICPGFIASPMTEKLGADYLEKVAAEIPLKRLGKPEEVAAMAKFLALEPAAGYITGHHFNVDGGIAIGV